MNGVSIILSLTLKFANFYQLTRDYLVYHTAKLFCTRVLGDQEFKDYTNFIYLSSAPNVKNVKNELCMEIDLG